MLRMEEWVDIVAAHHRGVSTKEIARQTGLSRDTIRKSCGFTPVIDRKQRGKSSVLSVTCAAPFWKAKPRLSQQTAAQRTNLHKTLISIEETGGPPKRITTSKYEVPAGFGGAYAAYRDELYCRGLKPSTQRGNLCTARCFFATCGADFPDNLTVCSIAQFTESIAGCAPQTRSYKLYVVRDMMRFLAARGDCPMEVAQCMPLIRGHKHSTIPSAYSRDEVVLLLEERSYEANLQPKHDRAIALLAGVLGMRASDIKALRLCDIDWRTKKIAFVQKKTQVSQTLLMPEEVWLALADYLKNESRTSKTTVSSSPLMHLTTL